LVLLFFLKKTRTSEQTTSEQKQQQQEEKTLLWRSCLIAFQQLEEVGVEDDDRALHLTCWLRMTKGEIFSVNDIST
jgi:hypothetical protein